MKIVFLDKLTSTYASNNITKLMINNSDPLGTSDWFQGTAEFTAQAGSDTSYIAANFENCDDGPTLDTISNWLLTPEMDLSNGMSLSFYTRTVADSAELTLQNVTDIETTVVGGVVQVFVSSATDHGFTQFALNIPNGADLIQGGAVVDVLTGTAANDTIYGYGRNDELRGMAGDDRLVDGRGNDQLWGGEGADVFEFIADGRKDYIMDFEIGVDRIDLRDVPMMYYFGDVDVISTADGAKLKYADEQIIITTIDNTPLNADMFTQEDFIFG